MKPPKKASEPSRSFGRGLPGLADVGETVEIGGQEALDVVILDSYTSRDVHIMFAHLGRAAGLVWGVKEAMWDELKVMVDRCDTSLKRYGWASHEYTEGESRKKFELLWDRYRAYVPCRLSSKPVAHDLSSSDMRERIAMTSWAAANAAENLSAALCGRIIPTVE